MSTAEIVANYIEHKRGLGMRFATENAILIAFGRFVGNVALCEIRSAMIPRFVDRGGTSDETARKKHHVLVGFSRFAVTRHLLKTPPMPNRVRKHHASSYIPYIYSEAELKRILAAVPAATGPDANIDADTWRSTTSQDCRCRPAAIAHSRSQDEVL